MTEAMTQRGAGLPGPSATSRAERPSALGRCIAISPAQFAGEYWGRQPLLTSATDSGADHSDLLSIAAVDELISRHGLRTPFVRMAKQGSVLTSASFTRAGGTGATIADQVADDKVLAQLSDGATLVLQALHRTWPPLIEFGSGLAAEVGHPIQINAYVTPAENQGFAAHYDTHDVFVLQVTGRKRWMIHEPVLQHPLLDQTWESRRADVAKRATEPPLLDVVLQPGDVLYLPRGYLHSAAALGELTIHLTVGIHPVTRYALAQQLLSSAAADERLRAPLPLGVDLADPAVLAPELATVSRLLAELVVAEADHGPDVMADRISAQLGRDTRPAPISPLAQLAAAATVTPSTLVALRPGLRLRLHHQAGQLRISFLDREMSLPDTTEAACGVLLTGRPTRIGALPGLTEDDQLALARQLLSAAVLVPVTDD
jgi:ribosomal protein L16 Arg81 hydroxylase